jgi:hypothetical protein
MLLLKLPFRAFCKQVELFNQHQNAFRALCKVCLSDTQYMATSLVLKENLLNYHLSHKLKLIGKSKFNHLINTLTFPLTCGLRLPFNR